MQRSEGLIEARIKFVNCRESESEARSEFSYGLSIMEMAETSQKCAISAGYIISTSGLRLVSGKPNEC